MMDITLVAVSDENHVLGLFGIADEIQARK